MDYVEDLAQCCACGRIFADVSVFDEHRIGGYDRPGQRRCLSARELSKCFIYGAGVWRRRPRRSTAPVVVAAIAS